MAKLHFDELKPKQWVVITGIIEEDTGWQESQPWTMHRRYSCDGVPLEVLAVDLPFILVEAVTGEKFSVDIRRFTVQRASKQYVQAAAKVVDFEHRPARSRVINKKRKIKVKPDPRDCPNCGSRMRQRRVEGVGGWRLVCPDCGLDKGPVEV